MEPFIAKVKGSEELQLEIRNAINDAIENIAVKHGATIAEHLEKGYENKPTSVGCIVVTNSTFCITI